MLPQTITCSINSVDSYNQDTRKILLDIPNGRNFNFRAGQYLEVVLPNKKCPFSIANSPSLENQIELHIRPTPESEDSVAIEKILDNADKIQIEGPFGDCFIDAVPKNTLILIAASTGISQMKSIVEYLEPTGFVNPVYLYWGVVSESDLYLSELCEFWKSKYRNFHFVPIVSEPSSSPDWKGRTGLVGKEALGDFEDVSNVTVYVSGGSGMVYATLDAFTERGMPEVNMHSDIFSFSPRSKS